MWLEVEGDSYYSVTSMGAITDNTGTGTYSWELFKPILDAISYLFMAYDIVNFVRQVYQEPPSKEWQRDEHWAKAIVMQSGNPHKAPRLQTACASLMSYFDREGQSTLTITAGAEIGLRIELHDIGGITVGSEHIGTYQVSYTVSFVVGLPPETPSTPSGQTTGYVDISYSYSTSAYDPDGDLVGYEFN